MLYSSERSIPCHEVPAAAVAVVVVAVAVVVVAVVVVLVVVVPLLNLLSLSFSKKGLIRENASPMKAGTRLT